MSSDTVYYECREELSFDTIPYMVKDQAFLDGLNELQLMLNGKIPYSLKRAEFIVEWAYSGGNMNYKKFCVHQQLGFNYLDRYGQVRTHYLFAKNGGRLPRIGTADKNLNIFKK